jgi:hypothetical protein
LGLGLDPARRRHRWLFDGQTVPSLWLVALMRHGDQARENLTFRNPCKFKDCHFLVRFERGLRLRIPLW